MNNTSYTQAAILGGLVSSLFTVTLMLGFQAVADQDGSTDNVPRLVPYNGTLSFDGVPMTLTEEDAPWLRFDIFDNEPADGQDPAVYSQSMQVNVYAGKFTAMLGPADDNGVNIINMVSDADNLSLEITILGDHDEDNPELTAGDDITLSNTQRLVFSPFAMWATNATNFNVTNTLTTHTIDVVSNLTVDGSISSDVGDVTISDNLTVEDGDLTLSANNSIVSTGDTVTIDDDLQVNGSVNSHTTTLTIDDDLFVAGDLMFTGSLSDSDSTYVTIADDLQVSTTIRASSNVLTVDDDLQVNGNVEFTGSLSDSDSIAVTIDDDLDVTGSSVLGSDGEGSTTIHNIAKVTDLPACVTVVMNDGNENGNTICNCIDSNCRGSASVPGAWECRQVFGPDGGIYTCAQGGSILRSVLCCRE